jgi:hypothetical protein
LADSRFCRTPADGRVEIEQAKRFGFGGKFARIVRSHGGGRNDHPSPLHGSSCAIFTKQNCIGLCGVDHDNQQDVRSFGHFCNA